MSCLFAICPCRTAAASANGSRPEMVYGSEEDERDTWRDPSSVESHDWKVIYVNESIFTLMVLKETLILNDLERFCASLSVFLERFLSNINTQICT